MPLLLWRTDAAAAHGSFSRLSPKRRSSPSNPLPRRRAKRVAYPLHKRTSGNHLDFGAGGEPPRRREIPLLLRTLACGIQGIELRFLVLSLSSCRRTSTKLYCHFVTRSPDAKARRTLVGNCGRRLLFACREKKNNCIGKMRKTVSASIHQSPLPVEERRSRHSSEKSFDRKQIEK